VFQAEAGRLVSPHSISAYPEPRLQVPPISASDDKREPELHEADEPHSEAPGSIEVLRGLYWAACWLRVVAVADLLAVPVFVMLASARGRRWGILFDAEWDVVIGMSFCLLTVIGPFAATLWANANLLSAVKLRGILQFFVPPFGIVLSVLVAIGVVLALSDRPRPGWSPQMLALLIAAGAAGMTMVACANAIRARRAAFAAYLPQRLGDAGDAEWPLPRRVERSQQRIPLAGRRAARSLRVGASVLLVWLPLNCVVSMAVRVHPMPGWQFFAMVSSAILLVLMFAGANALEQLRRPWLVRTASIASIFAAITFGLYFVDQVWRSFEREQLACFRIMFTPFVVICTGASGIKSWRALADPSVRHALYDE
jgi:hypothetical protein